MYLLNIATIMIRTTLYFCTVVLFTVICADVWFREVRSVNEKCMKNF